MQDTTAPYYADDHVTLWHGDAATTLAKLPDGSVDCIVTSPPYFGLRDYGVDGQIGAEATPGQFVASLVDVFHEARRCLPTTGRCGSTWATRTSTRAVLARRGRPGSAPHGRSRPRGAASW